jgi:hypothetical protein
MIQDITLVLAAIGAAALITASDAAATGTATTSA